MSGHGPVPGDTAHDPSSHPQGQAEPHHVPHGYVHPKEHHHWWWYAGIAVSCVGVCVMLLAFRQFDRAEAPLCSQDAVDSVASLDNRVDVEVVRVSCLGGGARQRLIMHEGGSAHTVVSFEDADSIRVRWASDDELSVHHDGKLVTFQPLWHGVRIRFH